MLWVGFKVHDEEKSVRPIAYAGFESGYLESVHATWAESGYGRGPVGITLRTGKTHVVSDISSVAPTAPWHQMALERGYKSLIVLPLKDYEETFGMLAIYAGTPDAFSAGEVEILEELANDLAFGIQSIRITGKEKKAAAQLKEVFAKEDAMLKSMGEAVVVVDTTGKIILANRAYEQLTQIRSGELLGSSIEKVTQLKDTQGHLLGHDDRPIFRAISTGVAIDPIELQLVTLSGKVVPVEVIASPVILDGRVAGAITVVRDITRAKEIEKLRLDFLSLASHQLRTPLSGTKWLIETLRARTLGPLTPKQEEYLQEIYTVNERMIRLVFDMLSALRLESGDLNIQKTPISIPQIFAGLMTTVGMVAQNKNITIHDRSAEHALPTFESDPAFLSTILEVFLSNALNYSPQGSTVSFDVVAEEDGVAFVVQDPGIGIPPEEQPRIFERFYRAANARTMRPDGTGLGLYIALVLAKKLGGMITFISRPGEGTTFALHVPTGSIKSGDTHAIIK